MSVLAATVLPAGACAHCGLAASDGGLYCCVGCEIAAELSKEGEEHQRELSGKLTLCLLLSMAVMMLSLFLFAEDVYGATAMDGLGWMRKLYRALALLLSTPVVALLGLPLARRAAARLVERRLGMDLLVSVSAIAAYALSVVNVLRGHGGVYFDSATSALVLSTLGRYLEATARAKASRVLAPTLALAAQPVLARLASKADDDDAFALTSPALVEPGMRLRVPIDQPVPVDARVIDHDVEVNLGVLSGLAVPVKRLVGEEIPSGAIPVGGPLDAVALRPARESTLERLAELARSLHAEPSRLQRLADRFAGALVPLVGAVALATLLLTARRISLESGLERALAVTLAACPCTYGVATPLALWLALRRALEEGACVRNAGVLESLAAVKEIAFDKTGTLTEAELAVIGAHLAEGSSESDIAALALGLEEGDPHPVGRAVRDWARTRTASPALIRARRHVAGDGVLGADELGRALRLGAPRDLASRERHRAELTRDGVVLAAFEIGESLRAEATSVTRELGEMGLSVRVLTGDSGPSAARSLGGLGVAIEADLTPQMKLDRVRARGAHLAMVGDGQNDALALAAGGPSFAMSSGTSLARGVSQVALLRPDLGLVPWTIALARRAVSIGRQNLVLSTLYNLLFVGLAASGLLRPVWAGVSMLLSSVLTLASSLRVARFPGHRAEVPR